MGRVLSDVERTEIVRKISTQRCAANPHVILTITVEHETDDDGNPIVKVLETKYPPIAAQAAPVPRSLGV